MHSISWQHLPGLVLAVQHTVCILYVSTPDVDSTCVCKLASHFATPPCDAGQQRGSRGPTQAEFHAATEVLFFNGQPVPRRRPPLSHQPPLQTQQQQQQLVFGEGSASTASWEEQVQQRQSWQGESGRGVKRTPGGEADMAPAAKRGKHADQVWPVYSGLHTSWSLYRSALR